MTTSTVSFHLKARLFWFLRFVLLPAVIYLCLLGVFTFPLFTRFSSSFMGDSGDVYQNVWSLWWFAQAVDNPELDLWHTNLLFYPHGASLYGHALSPLNGALVYPLQKVLTWHQVYNSLILFNFLATGLSMLYLAYYYTKSWLPSFVAGALYTFSAYHFLHSRGHMEMAAMQWLTFFTLSFVWLLDKPSWRKALLSALLLLLALWNTPYHLLYAVFIGAIIGGFYGWRLRKNLPRLKELLIAGLQFCFVSLVLLGPSLSSYSYHTATQMFVRAHDPKENSVEVFHYLARPDGFLGEKTKAFWPKLLESPGFSESQVRLHFISLVLAGVALLGLKKDYRLGIWLLVGTTFLLLSLGPIFLYRGYPLTLNGRWVEISLPYAWLEKIVPPLKLSGVPARMGAIPLMAACLLAGFGLKSLLKQKKRKMIVALLALGVIETIPKTITPLAASVPQGVTHLAALSPGGLLDLAHKPPLALYYQIFHRKPLTTGYLSRISLSNSKYLGALTKAQETNNFWLLCTTYQVKYYWVDFQIENLEPIITDGNTFIYDLKPEGNCLQLN